MIEQTDASKPSDERHVKDRCNTNLLTQKKTGGKHIMGNRGMTNWKLGAFFIISLMLFATVFSNAAIAADGAGTVTVNWSSVRSSDIAAPNVSGTDGESTNIVPLNAGTRWNAVQITYEALDGDNMGGGLVRIDLPGWAMGKLTNDTTTTKVDESSYYKWVTITSRPNAASDRAGEPSTTPGAPDILYSTGTGMTLNTPFGVTEANEQTAPAKALLAMVPTLSGDRVEVKLNAQWNNGGMLTIVLGDITTGIPNSLPLTDGNTLAPTLCCVPAHYQFYGKERYTYFVRRSTWRQGW